MEKYNRSCEFVTSSNSRVRRLKARISGLKERVGRLKAQVRRLKTRGVKRWKAQVKCKLKENIPSSKY